MEFVPEPPKKRQKILAEEQNNNRMNDLFKTVR